MSWVRVGFGLALVPLLGCALVPFRPTDLAPELEPVAELEHRETDLPPRQAAEVCLAAAQELEKNGREIDAIAQYEKAREHNPRLTQVSRRLAVLYDRQCDFQRALTEYRQALALAPHDADLLNDLGYCHYQRGDYVEAERWLRQATERNPKHQRAWVNLGLTLAWQGRYPESYDAFAKVVTPAQARANIGIVQAQQQRTAEAVQSLREALREDPDLRPVRAVLAQLEGAPASSVSCRALPGFEASQVLSSRMGESAAKPGRTGD